MANGRERRVEKNSKPFECPVKVLHVWTTWRGRFRKVFGCRGNIVILYEVIWHEPWSNTALDGSMEKGYQIVIDHENTRTRFLNFPTFTRFLYGQLLCISKILVWFPILETQCGSRHLKGTDASLDKKLDITGWIFDLELIYKSKSLQSFNGLKSRSSIGMWRNLHSFTHRPDQESCTTCSTTVMRSRNYPVPWLDLSIKSHRLT